MALVGFDVMRITGGVLRAERGDDALGNHPVLCVQLEDCWRFHNHPASPAGSFDFYYQQADEDLFAQKCHWLSTAADSPFVQSLVCQRAVPGGYDVQIGRVVKWITSAGTQQHLINSAEELVESLLQLFGLDVPEKNFSGRGNPDSPRAQGLLNRHPVAWM